MKRNNVWPPCGEEKSMGKASSRVLSVGPENIIS